MWRTGGEPMISKTTAFPAAAPLRSTAHPSRRGAANAVLVGGLIVLAAGASAFFLRPAGPAPLPPPQPPRIEVAYAEVPADIYRALTRTPNAADGPIPGVLSYRIGASEVASRIATDAAFLTPEGLRPPGGESNFAAEFRRGRFRFHHASVVVLIVKQVGKGDADSVAVDLYRVVLPQSSPMVDPTDAKLLLPPKADERPSEFDADRPHPDSIRLALGHMSTGDAVIVPLYSILSFADLKEGGRWGFVKDLALVPVNVHYHAASGS